MTSKPSPTPPPSPVEHTALVGELTDSIAPMPTARTLRVRTLLPYQLYRFGMVNAKMLKMIRRSHTR
jgi:hypothetical protein